MIPVVVIIGRPNVGKSTLFNRLTCSHDALVADFPELTRDRKYGYAKIGNFKFICIDTGNINNNSKDFIKIYTTKQSFLAIKEANLVLFLVDAHIGLTLEDVMIAKYLRSCRKPIFLIANKTDCVNIDLAISDFWSLGLGTIHPISALYGRGISGLLKKLSFFFKKSDSLLKVNIKSTNIQQYQIEDINEESNNITNKQSRKLIKLAIVGCPNVGKSTFINCVLGEERVVVHSLSGTTRDSVCIPALYANYKYLLIDTAGIRKNSRIIETIEKLSKIKAMQAIENADVVVMIIDAHKGVSNQDLSLLHFILSKRRPFTIAINKWDNLTKREKKHVKEEINYRLKFINFVRIHFISALYNKNIKKLFESIFEAYTNANQHISTSELTRIMNVATENHQPPLINGQRVRLKLAHVGGYNPLTIIIHGNRVNNLSESYKRYLMNYFRETLSLMGIFLDIKLKENNNPYFDRKTRP